MAGAMAGAVARAGAGVGTVVEVGAGAVPRACAFLVSLRRTQSFNQTDNGNKQQIHKIKCSSPIHLSNR